MKRNRHTEEQVISILKDIVLEDELEDLTGIGEFFSVL